MLNLTEHQEPFSKQLPKNVISNAIYFMLNIVIGLFLVPFFIDSLGVASYALIPLATSLTSYVNLIVQSLNETIARHLTISLQKGDFKNANIVFNTALFGTMVIVLAMIPVVLFISYNITSFFEIPDIQMNDVRVLFFTTLLAFLLRAWSSNFEVSLFAYNRLDLKNIVNSVSFILQTVLIVTLFKFASINLRYIGIAYLIGAISALILTVYFSSKINPHLKISINYFQLTMCKTIAEMGGWVLITQIGSLLFLQIDLILVNKLFGTIAGGEYSIALTWSVLLRSVAGIFAGNLTPIVLTYYAKDRTKDIINLSKSSVKLMGLALALPIGYICSFAPQLLSIWVGSNFSKLGLLMVLMLSHLVINLEVMPLFAINIAYNKVKIPSLITCFMGIGNLLLAIILASIAGWGYYGVAGASAIVLSLKNAFFTPWYATRVLGIPKNSYIYSMIPGVLALFLVIGFSRFMAEIIGISDITHLVGCGIALSAMYLLVVWNFGLKQAEKQLIQDMFLMRKKIN